MPPAPLPPAVVDALVAALRHGEHVEAAAAAVGVDLPDVWATARTDTRLTIALAGRDPDSPVESARVARAEYLRLLALGVPPSRAVLIMGAGDPSSWRSEPLYAEACRAAIEAAAPLGYSRQIRLTPERVGRFLEELRAGATVTAAAGAVGVTPVAIYQRRHRDGAFAAAMDEARNGAKRPRRTTDLPH